ncbi:SAM-dependent methyltransferase [Ahrensia marina]|uniref:SAM-dependent methyltransferase n=1 Tax=Ahrensia marina TaxID=1514904 RepID=UPI0006B5BC1F|nr:SAM-dependent methyltransferase [Ahrensia marina]
MNIRSLPQNNAGKKQRRARVQALATLPVFYKLHGKKVVLAGGSDAAAWKAELLAAAGADVHIYAQELEPAFAALIAEPGVSGHFIWYKKNWEDASFAHSQIAICDAETDAEAQRFYCAAHAAGVAVNIIDKPDYCDFQFGSIVNRSPVVISISTDGAAPILGQAIRRRIEAVIAQSVSAWATLALEIRSVVNDRLEMGLQRRTFWEAFVDRAFERSPRNGDIEGLIAEADTIANFDASLKGKITFVNVRADDAELLTLKAVRALQAADIIMFDDDVSSDVLELARREAERILIDNSKIHGANWKTDSEDKLAALALAGKNVVWLQSGNPQRFGQFEEKITRLCAEGIPVSVVPGIIAAADKATQIDPFVRYEKSERIAL